MGAVRQRSLGMSSVSEQPEERPSVKGRKSEGWGLRSMDRAQNRMLQRIGKGVFLRRMDAV